MRIGFIGAGNMATALARGWGEPVLVSDVDHSRAEALAEELGGEALGANAYVADGADAIVLCHKPAQLGEAELDERLVPGVSQSHVSQRFLWGRRNPFRLQVTSL